MDTTALRAAVADRSLGAWLGRIRPAEWGRASAVLVAFSGTHVVLVEKSGRLRRHAGQWAFPGGALDAGETVVDAALREATEETGMLPAEVEVWGTMATTHIPVSGYDVTPVVAHWPRPRPLQVGDTEVVDIRQVPWSELCDPAHRCVAVHTPSGFESAGFSLADDVFVWGFTGFVLDEIIRAAGWQQPWDATRKVAVPSHRGG